MYHFPRHFQVLQMNICLYAKKYAELYANLFNGEIRSLQIHLRYKYNNSAGT